MHALQNHVEREDYTINADAEIVSKAVSIHNKYTQNLGKFFVTLVVAATEFVGGLGDPTRFFVFFEGNAAEQSGHHAPRAPGGGRRQTRGGDDRRHFAVAVAVLGTQERDAAVGPPETGAHHAGEEEPEEGEEHPVLTHLVCISGMFLLSTCG